MTESLCPLRDWHEYECVHGHQWWSAPTSTRCPICGTSTYKPGEVVNGTISVMVAVSPACTGYCIGTGSAETLVEDLGCPVHGIDAQSAAEKVFPDRQAWLDSLADAE